MSARSGKVVRQAEIMRYVYSCLMHNPSDEPQPLGELELAKRFRTNRLTIRRALSAFENDGRLIRIPGRRGLFMNPAAARAIGDYYFLGIMTQERANRYLDSGTQLLISGFAGKLRNLSADYHYLEIASSEPQDAVEEILNCGLDGLLWCSPPSRDIPVIEELSRRNFPFVVVAPPHKSSYPLPAKNCIQPDFAQIGILRAQCVRDAGCGRIAYFGTESPTFQAFLDFFSCSEREYIMNHRCTRLESGIAGIRMILADGADCLVADGRIFFFLPELHRSLPELRNVTLVLDPVPHAFQVQRKYPDLKIRIPFYDWSAVQWKLGERAAIHLLKSMRGGGGFHSEIMPVRHPVRHNGIFNKGADSE